MIYGYARFNFTTISIEEQIQKLKLVGVVEVIVDRELDNFKNFTSLMEKLRAGDSLFITHLENIALTVQEALKIIEDLYSNNIRLTILNLERKLSIDHSFLDVLKLLSSFEKNTLIERTKRGRLLAKQNPNYKEGAKPKYTENQLLTAVKMLETSTYDEVSVITGISKSTLSRAKKKLILNNKL